MDYSLVQSLATVLVLGFAIGMQRSLTYRRAQERSFAGSRTFALIALAGFLAAWLDGSYRGITVAVTAGIVFLLGVAYYLKVRESRRWGMTTQVAALVTFLLGVLAYRGETLWAVSIGVLVIILLEIKPRLQALERHIGPNDVNAVILLLAMSFVILPILPDRMIGPGHLFNPYKTWLMAVIIAAISFIGYVAIKLFGQKHGVFLTGAAGGLISSTAVSISLSRMYRGESALIANYAGGIAIACTFMFLRVLFEAFVIHPELAWRLSPAYLGATMGGLLYSGWFYRHAEATEIDLQNSTISKNPLQLSEAIKFGILFGIVYGAVALVQARYGDIGVYLVSFFSGLTDVDAITLSLSEMAKEGKLEPFASMTGIVIASVTNSLVKLGIVYWLGGVRLGWELTKFFFVTLGLMGAGLAAMGHLG